MFSKPRKLLASLFVVTFISAIFFQSGSARSSLPETKTPQLVGASALASQITNAPVNCTVTTGPLISGISSTYFSQGDLYKVGSSFNCVDMREGAVIGVGDFNNDGRKDVVLTTTGWSGSGFAYEVYIFWQDTQGNLSTLPTVYPGGNLSLYLAVGDLNHDGLDDFVTADRFDGKISVFLQQGNGTMIKTPYPAVYQPDALAVGDINNDGLDDVVVPSAGIEPGSIGVFTQNQNGTLNTMITYPSINAGYDDIAIGDVNHDGLNDVVKLNGQGTLSDILVYLQTPSGQLNDYVAYSLGSFQSYRGMSVAVGDVTGDALSDVVVSYGGSWPTTKIAVFAQDASGILQPPVSYLAFDYPKSVELADANGDGRLDVIVAHSFWQNIGVFLQLPNGTLAKETLYPANYSDVLGLSYDDLNNDTLIDLVAIDSRGFDVLYREPTFSDTPLNYWAGGYIERLYRAGITGGCSTNPLMYCPGTNVTRAQMAIFLLRGEHGQNYAPPVAKGTVFGDVPDTYWAAAWIEQLFAEGITGGCGNGKYCPDTAVTRDQMAVFLLRAKYGVAYTPPAISGVFADVPADNWAAAWIEQLAAEGITGGCGGGNYCPTMPVTRAQMAVFLARTFSLP